VTNVGLGYDPVTNVGLGYASCEAPPLHSSHMSRVMAHLEACAREAPGSPPPPPRPPPRPRQCMLSAFVPP
jgi:hypothetical protein